MTDKTSPSCIVVTGASSGIGQALSLAYAASGVVLGLIGRDTTRLEACAQACRARGAEVFTGCIDVRQAEALKTWLDEFDAAHPIDLLIANAGVEHVLYSADDWEDLATASHVINTNLFGEFNTVFPIIDRMRVRMRGHIAMVASLAALRGMPITPAYCASKAAIKVWADSVRPLLKHRGVTLSVILPGYVKTAMTDDFDGNKPFMWPADRAAHYIRRKLTARRSEIAFPFLLHWGQRLLAFPPPWVGDFFMNAMSFLPKEKNNRRVGSLSLPVALIEVVLTFM